MGLLRLPLLSRSPARCTAASSVGSRPGGRRRTRAPPHRHRLTRPSRSQAYAQPRPAAERQPPRRRPPTRVTGSPTSSSSASSFSPREHPSRVRAGESTHPERLTARPR